MATRTRFTAPGLSNNEGAAAAELLQDRLSALTDLQLTLKHVHWNVVGPNFIAVHKMLDPQVKAVRKMVDETAERIAALGVAPMGTLAALARARGEDEYPLGREDAMIHLEALDGVYDAVISAHRQAMHKLEDIDLVSQDMLIQQLADLEQFQWFVRAHREDPSGTLTAPYGSTRRSGPPASAIEEGIEGIDDRDVVLDERSSGLNEGEVARHSGARGKRRQ